LGEREVPNIASILKDEIMRLARKELRGETQQLKKASALYRSEIAALKRRVIVLERQLKQFERVTTKKTAPPATPAEHTRARYSAQGLRNLRQRLGLSAADLAALLDVSAQTIYNWEAESTRPRDQQVVAIAALRGVGKREATARLAEIAG
jgi:DNA-binding transcriptional regulator YiaG